MSFLGNIGHAITKGVSDAGHFVGKVADNPIAKTLTAAALAATGVGVPASAAIMGTMAGGGALLKPGGNIGGALKAGATGAAEGALAGKLAGMARGAGSIGSKIAGAAGAIGVPAGHGGVADASVGGDGSGTGVSLADRLKTMAMSAGSSLLGGGTGPDAGGGGTSVLDKLLMGGTIAAGAVDDAQKRGLQNKAADYATGPYDAKAGLRAKALTALQSPPPVDPRIAAASADPGNVYDRGRRARMLAAAATSAAPGTTPTAAPGAPAPMGLSALLAQFGKPSPAPVLS